MVKSSGHRLHVVIDGGRNYKLDANVEWIIVGSVMTFELVITNSWLLRHQRSNVVESPPFIAPSKCTKFSVCLQHVSVLHK